MEALTAPLVYTTPQVCVGAHVQGSKASFLIRNLCNAVPWKLSVSSQCVADGRLAMLPSLDGCDAAGSLHDGAHGDCAGG